MKLEDTVNFFWNMQAPVDGYNNENYSARWIGYLRIPKMGKYVFYSVTDDGA